MTGRSGTSPQQHPVVSECYERSLALLKLNSKASGIIACSPSKKATDRNYASIFGRDAAICSLGMVVSGDRDLRRIARRSLIALGQHQAVNGQIPKFIKPEQGEVDFWYAGCIDATLWWLIAVEFFNRHCP
ncbi:MAG: glycoside hydrolase, partial [Thermodesulfobacteriota bacterium]